MFLNAKSIKRLDYSRSPTQQKTLIENNNVWALAVLSEGQLAGGDSDSTIRVWDSETGQRLQTLTGHSKWIFGLTGGSVKVLVALSNDQLASGSFDYTIKVWDVKTGKCLQTLTGHSREVVALAVLSEGHLASGSPDCTVKIWDIKAEKCLRTLTGHINHVLALAALANNQLASGSHDYTIKVWDVKTGKCLQTLKHGDVVRALAALTEERLASGASDNIIKVWNIKKGECLQTLTGHNNTGLFGTSGWGICALTVLPDGQLVSGSTDCTTKIWDLKRGKCIQTLTGHNRAIYALAVLHDGQLVSSSNDAIKVWDFPILEDKDTLPLSAPSSEVKTSSAYGSLRIIEYTKIKIDKKLGQGGYGEVYLGMYGYEQVVIKKLLRATPNKDDIAEFEKEMKIMSILSSQYIVQFRGVCLSPQCIVMEYMPKGSLYHVLHSDAQLSWELRGKIALDIAKGLAFLHAEQIIHRDLKSLNVLLDNSYQAKLCDFGFAKIKTETATISSINPKGTVAWMAPELFDFDKGSKNYSFASDMYSYGMVVWELSTRKEPFADEAAGKIELVKGWVIQGKRETISTDTPVEIKQVIESCWKQNPNERLTADKVIEALQKFSLFAASASMSPTVASSKPISGPMYVSNFK